MISNQIMLFLLYIAVGFSCGLIFDFFRSLRKRIKTSNIATYIEDIIFWILVGIIIFFVITTFSLGEIRSYTFAGITIGFIVYYIYCSKYIIKFNFGILSLLIYIYRKVEYYFKYIFMKPIKFIIINIRKLYTLKNKKNLKKKEGL